MPRSICSFALALIFSVSGATGSLQAGPNEGGVLIVHTDPSIEFCFQSYEGRSNLERCEDGDTNAPSDLLAFWVHAAFPTDGSPRLTSVSFGIEYPGETVFISSYGPSGDASTDTPTWPLPGSGTTVTWTAPRLDFVPEVYWFLGYEYYGLDVSFDLTVHPDGLPGFEDDSVPALVDGITDFGRLGFGTDPGYLPCPGGPPLGACCFADGSCLVLTESGCADGSGTHFPDFDCNPTPCLGACCFPDGSCSVESVVQCDSVGGTFLATGTTCDPNPCPPPPVGACCFPEGTCLTIDAFECADDNGIYLGDDVSCDPDPCPDPGACCFESGVCLVRQESDCPAPDGTFLGEGSECEPNPCPQPDGACCVGTECSLQTEEECTVLGGAFAGDFSDCSPGVCTETGACCFGESCATRLLASCLAESGVFLGNNVPCEPGACLRWDCDAELRAVAKAGPVDSQAEFEPMALPAPGSDDHSVPRFATSGTPCGELLMNSDGTYETGYTYSLGGGGGYGAPCFGAFAERFTHPGPVCAVVLDLSQVEGQTDERLDIYVWENGDGHPGAVRSVAVGLDPGPAAIWPSVSRHVLPLDADPEGDTWWAGCWGGAGILFVCADLDGPEPGGTPMTLVKPDSGWPFDGWQDVAEIWNSTQALGIGAQVADDPSSVPGPAGDIPALSLAPPFPNPASDRIRVEFQLGTEERVRIRLVDVQGRVVGRAAEEFYDRGSHRLEWVLPEGISSGKYFLHLDAGGEVVTRAVTVTR